MRTAGSRDSSIQLQTAGSRDPSIQLQLASAAKGVTHASVPSPFYLPIRKRAHRSFTNPGLVASRHSSQEASCERLVSSALGLPPCSRPSSIPLKPYIRPEGRKFILMLEGFGITRAPSHINLLPRVFSRAPLPTSPWGATSLPFHPPQAPTPLRMSPFILTLRRQLLAATRHPSRQLATHSVSSAASVSSFAASLRRGTPGPEAPQLTLSASKMLHSSTSAEAYTFVALVGACTTVFAARALQQVSFDATGRAQDCRKETDAP